LINTVTATDSGSGSRPQKLDPQRLAHAAHQFEAVLLNQLLGSLEHTFSTLSHKETGAEDHYHFLGVQAVASHIAANGGIGIAKMIIRSFPQQSDTNIRPFTDPQKSPSQFEGLNLNF
jgi:Rod binding domain-containing protein